MNPNLVFPKRFETLSHVLLPLSEFLSSPNKLISLYYITFINDIFLQNWITKITFYFVSSFQTPEYMPIFLKHKPTCYFDTN